MKIKKLNKNLGFSLVELTITLVVFGAIVLITTQIIEQVNVKKNINAQKAVITAYENSVIKQINANYDSIYSLASKNSNQQLIYTYDNFNDYALTGSNPTDLLYQSFFKPCVLIKADTARNTLSAALIYPANQNILKNSAALSSELGNASFLSTDKWIGNIATNYFTSQNIQSLANSCNSNINSFKTGSIFIDLNKNSSMISRKTNITDNSTNNGTNETLKNNGDSNSYNKSIGTNLYFDAIVKESTPWSNYYCDGSRAEIQYSTDVHNTCVAYAQSNSTYLDGVEKITNGGLVGNKCQYTASANFSGYFTSTWVGANSPAELQAKGQSYINAGCQWQSTNSSTSNPNKFCIVTWEQAEARAPNRSCRYGNTYQCTTGGVTKEFTVCSESPQNQAYLNQGCVKTYGPWQNTAEANYSGFCTTLDLDGGASQEYVDYILCKIGGTISTPTECGKFLVDAYINSGVTPPQHKFKSLSFGDKGSGNILVKSGTADGTSTESDTYLNIQKAGVKSGYILLRSKAIAADSACKSSELGKMIQQQDESTNYTTSQLVCSYDLDFCGGNGYCYTPLVSQSQFVDKPNSYSISCPAGLRVDVSWNPTVANGGLSYEKCYSGTTQLNVSINQLQSGKKVTGLSTTCQTANGTPLNYLNRIKCVSSSTEKILTGCKGGDNATCQ